MSDISIPDLRRALRLAPAGPLAGVRLPAVVSTGGGAVHSADVGQDCGELRAWGGVRGVTAHSLAELAALTFVTDNPDVTVCDGACGAGEDLDDVLTYARAALAATRRVTYLQDALNTLEDRRSGGLHRRGRADSDQLRAWMSLIVACAYGPWEARALRAPTSNELMAENLIGLDVPLAAWFRSEIADIEARVDHARTAMLTDRDKDDAGDRGAAMSGPSWMYLRPNLARLGLPVVRAAVDAPSLVWHDADDVPHRVVALPRALGDAEPRLTSLGPWEPENITAILQRLEVAARLHAHSEAGPLAVWERAYETATAILAGSEPASAVRAEAAPVVGR